MIIPMKKNLFYAFLSAAALAGCQSDPRATITGRLEGLECDSLLVMYGNFGQRSEQLRDTIALRDGRFEFHLTSDHIQEFHIWELPSAKPLPDGRRRAMKAQSLTFPLLPSSSLEIVGTLTDYTLSGDPFYVEFQEFRASLEPINQRIADVMAEVKRLQEAHAPQAEVMKAYEPMRQLSLDRSDMTFDYIRTHPDSDVAVCLLNTISIKQATEGLNLISERARTGKMADVYLTIKNCIEREAHRQEAAKSLTEGVPAPDFSVTTMDGSTLSLASLRGKYVVLDFWGTWCGWCIKGMPQMKEAYAKCSGQIEFVGIACNDTEARWRKSVEDLALPWLHTLNTEDNDLSVLYGVGGYPTKFILTPEGKILKKFVGETPDFYTTLDPLLK